MPGPEQLHVCSFFFFFGRESHDFLIWLTLELSARYTEYAAVHLQRLEDAGEPVGKFTSRSWP